MKFKLYKKMKMNDSLDLALRLFQVGKFEHAIDLLKKVSVNSNKPADTRTKIEIGLEVAHCNKCLGNYSKAFEILENLSELINHHYYFDLLALYYKYHGSVYYAMQDYQKANYWYEEALIHAIKHNSSDTILYASIIECIGNTHFRSSEYIFALEKYKLAQDLLLEQSVLTSNLSDLYLQIAKVYENLQDLKSAELYYLKAIEVDKKMHLKSALVTKFNEIAHFYYKINKIDKSFRYLRQSVMVMEELRENTDRPVVGEQNEPEIIFTRAVQSGLRV